MCFRVFPLIADISVFLKSEPNHRRLFKSELKRVSVQYPRPTWFDIEHPQYPQVRDYGMTEPDRRKARSRACHYKEINSAASCISLPLQAGFSGK